MPILLVLWHVDFRGKKDFHAKTFFPTQSHEEHKEEAIKTKPDICLLILFPLWLRGFV